MLIRVARFNRDKGFLHGFPLEKSAKPQAVLVHKADLRGGCLLEDLDDGDILECGSIVEGPRGLRGLTVFFKERPVRALVVVKHIRTDDCFAKIISGGTGDVFIPVQHFEDESRDKPSLVFMNLSVGQYLTCRIEESRGKVPVGMCGRPAGPVRAL